MEDKRKIPIRNALKPLFFQFDQLLIKESFWFGLRFGFSAFSLIHPHFALGSPPEPLSPSPRTSEPLPFENHYFGLGAYQQTLKNKISKEYSVKGLGVQFHLSEPLHDSFEGGLHVAWEDWQQRTQSAVATVSNTELGAESASKSVAPLFLLSQLNLSGPRFGDRIQVLGGGGLGILAVFEERTLLLKKSEKLPSDVIINGFIGMRFYLVPRAAIRLSAEVWRGVKVLRYEGTKYSVWFEFGGMKE
jgi:hypothetical protein